MHGSDRVTEAWEQQLCTGAYNGIIIIIIIIIIIAFTIIAIIIIIIIFHSSSSSSHPPLHSMITRTQHQHRTTAHISGRGRRHVPRRQREWATLAGTS